jgi:hypothetical protein
VSRIIDKALMFFSRAHSIYENETDLSLFLVSHVSQYGSENDVVGWQLPNKYFAHIGGFRARQRFLHLAFRFRVDHLDGILSGTDSVQKYNCTHG